MKNVNYEDLFQRIRALTEDVPYLTANLANTSALLWEMLPDLNWAGFYQLTDEALVLGPFQGRPACIRIPVGKGVCGGAVKEKLCGWKTFTPFRATLPATAPPIRKS